MACLEPGGFLQWDEMDYPTTKAIAPNLSLSSGNVTDIIRTLGGVFRHMGLHFGFVSQRTHCK